MFAEVAAPPVGHVFMSLAVPAFVRTANDILLVSPSAAARPPLCCRRADEGQKLRALMTMRHVAPTMKSEVEYARRLA